MNSLGVQVIRVVPVVSKSPAVVHAFQSEFFDRQPIDEAGSERHVFVHIQIFEFLDVVTQQLKG